MSDVLVRPERPTTAAPPASARERRFCSLPVHVEHPLPEDLNPTRMRAIVLNRNKWVNRTVLHYVFLGTDASERQKAAVRAAFRHWRDEGIGLSFTEVDAVEEAEVRIAFAPGGSWSYVGTSILEIPYPEPTMSFGWDLTDEWGRATALHEIGHTLGLPHEHQNPKAGIVWNEAKVYAYFLATQGWDREKTYNNIIRKIPPQDVCGTAWDPTSIMHYPFPAGLIAEPTAYSGTGTGANTVLSKMDIAFIRSLYPGDAPAEKPLEPMTIAPLSLKPGGQADFRIEPTMTRTYRIQTVGESDSKLVLFEIRGGEPRYLAADDDSAVARNATLEQRLLRGHTYLLRARLHYAAGPEGFGVMMV